jgi:P-type Cu+ transporter
MTLESKAIDPVCGMTIPTTGATQRHHDGHTYYLCSELCVARFDLDAMAYVATSKLNLKGWGRTPTPGFLLPPDDNPTGRGR